MFNITSKYFELSTTRHLQVESCIWEGVFLHVVPVRIIVACYSEPGKSSNNTYYILVVSFWFEIFFSNDSTINLTSYLIFVQDLFQHFSKAYSEPKINLFYENSLPLSTVNCFRRKI